MDDSERRRLQRKYLIVYSRVFERNLGKLLGYLGDLSPIGAMIISEQPLEENQLIELRFDLPDTNLFEVDRLDMTARVAHCQPDISPSFYNIGFEFLDVTTEKTKVIERMMEAYEFRRDTTEYPISPSVLDEE